MTRIHTYYADVPGISAYDSLRLITLWRERWAAVGFEPIVLNEHIARRHPDFDKFDAAISKLPTINASAYEKSCYHRHLAMAQVGGGILSDYDVMPINRERIEVALDAARGPFTIFQTKNVCPSLVCATEKGYEDVCRRFAAYVPKLTDMAGERPHTSDMLILEQQAIHEPVTLGLVDLVRCYGEVDPETTGAIHFSNGSMHNQPGPRWKRIKEILSV